MQSTAFRRAHAFPGGIFACVEAEAAAGDGAIIQFGHNDEKVDDAERGTEPWSSFMANLVHMASTLKGKGVYTVIATPIPRRKFIGGMPMNPATNMFSG